MRLDESACKPEYNFLWSSSFPYPAVLPQHQAKNVFIFLFTKLGKMLAVL